MLRINLKGKNVLIIGSGSDLDGRNMQQIIDSDYYDLIVRINKPYGDIKDVGERTDIVFFRYISNKNRHWNQFNHLPYIEQPKYISFGDGHKAQRGYDRKIANKYKLKMSSTGLCAVLWLKERGVNNIDVIGYGVKDGVYDSNKVYAVTKQKDNNQNFDWQKEHDIMKEYANFI